MSPFKHMYLLQSGCMALAGQTHQGISNIPINMVLTTFLLAYCKVRNGDEARLPQLGSSCV